MDTLASVTLEKKNEKSVYRIFVVEENEDDETKKKWEHLPDYFIG